VPVPKAVGRSRISVNIGTGIDVAIMSAPGGATASFSVPIFCGLSPFFVGLKTQLDLI
jgi:hypothetical protein